MPLDISDIDFHNKRHVSSALLLLIFIFTSVVVNAQTCDTQFGIITNDTIICPGSQIQLHAKEALEYTWSPATGLSGTNIQNPVLTFTNIDTYYLLSKGYAQSLVVNGDFEQGNTGFSSTYNYCNTGNCLAALASNGFAIGNNANTFHTLFQGTDHTTGNGKFMIINGADPNLVVWRETVTVTTNTEYAFGAWISSMSTTNPAKIRLSINGTQLGTVYNAPGVTNSWDRIYATWNSGNSNTAVIEIVNVYNESNGNDFGLDDIFFGELLSCTDQIQFGKPHQPLISISILANNLCVGAPVNFTTVSAEVIYPEFHWLVNGLDQGVGTRSFQISNPRDADNVQCLLRDLCTGFESRSNMIVVHTKTVVDPSVSIDGPSTICADGTALFTAAAVNAGAAPVYQWQLNGSNAGLNNSTYAAASLKNGDVISCTINGNSGCSVNTTAVSNSIVAMIHALADPSVVISGPASPVCAGSIANFTATPAGTTAAPSYQWILNNSNVGTGAPIYSNSNLKENDVLQCVITDNDVCALSNTAVSNSIVIKIDPAIQPKIIITTPDSVICAGTLINFHAAVTDPGVNLSYQWQINGANTGSNSAEYSNATLHNTDIVSCAVKNDLSCAVDGSASNKISITVFSLPVIGSTADKTIFNGESILLNLTTTGNIVSYSWSPPASLSNYNISSPLATPATSTIYQLIVKDINNCVATGSITIRVLNKIQAPNAFSPNGDGVNDTWVIANISGYSNCKVDIFNRYGSKVYHSTGYNKPWDGRYNDQPLPFGTYYYTINPGDGLAQISGSVTIIK